MILVTTADKVGAETARLLAQGERAVRVLVRDPGKHADLTHAGVDVVAGDLDDDASIRAALVGIDRVVLVSPAVPAQELAVVDAAAAADVTHVVKVTSKASFDSPVARRRRQNAIEQGLLASGLHHTLLRANAYMQNLLTLASVIAATGGFAASTGRGQVGLTDARDVAAVATRVITEGAQHVGRTYWATGSELLSYTDVASVLSDVLSQTITFTTRSREEDLSAMLAAGVAADVAGNNGTAFALIADGDAAWLSDDLPTLIGRPARSFDAFAREHATAFTAIATKP